MALTVNGSVRKSVGNLEKQMGQFRGDDSRFTSALSIPFTCKCASPDVATLFPANTVIAKPQRNRHLDALHLHPMFLITLHFLTRLEGVRLHTHKPTLATKSLMIWVAQGCGQTVTTATRSRARQPKFAPLA